MFSYRKYIHVFYSVNRYLCLHLVLCILVFAHIRAKIRVCGLRGVLATKLCLPMAQGYGVLHLVIVIEHALAFYSCLRWIYVLVFIYEEDWLPLGRFIRVGIGCTRIDWSALPTYVHIRPWVVGGNRNILYTAGGWISHSYLERI